jgi:hypothetical protein
VQTELRLIAEHPFEIIDQRPVDIAPHRHAIVHRLFQFRKRSRDQSSALGVIGGIALIDPAKLHLVGRWHHVAQTFDATTYRSYVDGALQDEAPLPFTPQPAGRSSVGVRINRVSYFHGALREACFTDRALSPSQFAYPKPR